MKKITIDTVLNNTYRKQECRKKITFILKNTAIPLLLLDKASSLIRQNEYHNFDHVLGATEFGIKIALKEKLSRKDITEIAFDLLLHDAGHQGFATPEDEKRSVIITTKSFSEGDFESMGLHKASCAKSLQRNILATVFKDRGTIHHPSAYIMQDADLAHIGQGPYYWLWSSMGLLDEFNKLRTDSLTPTTFIKEEQRKLLVYLQQCSNEDGCIWLSQGAQQLFNNPWDDIDEIESFGDEVCNYAYEVRFTDITITEFKKHIVSITKKYKKVTTW